MRWTKKEVATLMRMREHGHTFPEIADKLGRSQQAVTLKYHRVALTNSEQKAVKTANMECDHLINRRILSENKLPEPVAEVQLELPLEQPIWHEPADQYENKVDVLREMAEGKENILKDLTFQSPELKYHYLLAGLIIGSLATAVLYTQ